MSEWLKCEANVRTFYFYSLRNMLLIFSVGHGNRMVGFRNIQQIYVVLSVPMDFKSISLFLFSFFKTIFCKESMYIMYKIQKLFP